MKPDPKSNHYALKSNHYDPKAIMQEMMEAVVALYETPSASGDHMSLSAIGEELELSPQKVKKFLITAGVYDSEIADEVRDLREEGKTVQEIMQIMNLSMTSVNSYLPYTRPVYKTEQVSEVAERLQRFRKKQSAISELKEKLKECGEEEQLEILWDALYNLQGMSFETADGNKFTIRLKSVEYVGDGYSREEETPGTHGKKYVLSDRIYLGSNAGKETGKEAGKDTDGKDTDGKNTDGKETATEIKYPDTALKYFKEQYAKGYKRTDGTVCSGDVLIIQHPAGYAWTKAIPAEEVVKAYRNGRRLYMGTEKMNGSHRVPVDDRGAIESGLTETSLGDTSGEFSSFLYPILGRLGLLEWTTETFEESMERWRKERNEQENYDDDEEEIMMQEEIKSNEEVTAEEKAVADTAEDATEPLTDIDRYHEKMRRAIAGGFENHPEQLADWTEADETMRTIYPMTVLDAIRTAQERKGMVVVLDEGHEKFSQAEKIASAGGMRADGKELRVAVVDCEGENGKKLSTKVFLQRWVDALCSADPQFNYLTGNSYELEKHLISQLERNNGRTVTVFLNPQFLCKKRGGKKGGYSALGEGVTLARMIWDMSSAPMVFCCGTGFKEVLTLEDGSASASFRWRCKGVVQV